MKLDKQEEFHGFVAASLHPLGGSPASSVTGGTATRELSFEDPGTGGCGFCFLLKEGLGSRVYGLGLRV